MRIIVNDNLKLHHSDSSTTYSAIGATISLTLTDSQHQDSKALTTLSRDTEHANSKVKRFDIEEMQERQEMAQVIGEIANNAIQMTLKPRLDKAVKSNVKITPCGDIKMTPS